MVNISFTVHKDGQSYRLYQAHDGTFHANLPVKNSSGKVVHGKMRDVVIPRKQFVSAYRAYQKVLQD